jgi:hypothetical protein
MPRERRTFTLAGSLQGSSEIARCCWHRITCLVFQASWAALTFLVAVSSVKGGKGDLDSLAMLKCCVLMMYYMYWMYLASIDVVQAGIADFTVVRQCGLAETTERGRGKWDLNK